METDRGIYLSIAELVRRYRAPGESTARGPLTSFELRCFSQHGEDGVIAELLARVGIGSQFFVEFGIETGREGNCVFLADVLGWRGLFIEPDETGYSELGAKYRASERVRTQNAAVTPTNVESLFAAADVPPEPDVLSIDVDGQDYWIWEALEAYRPRVVVVEYNALLPSGRRLVQPSGYERGWDGTDYFGASLDALCELAGHKGYRLVHTDLAAVNAFFARGDLGGGALPSDEEVPRRHHPNYFMQGYRHPADPERRPYLDLTLGRPADPSGAAERPATRAPDAPRSALARDEAIALTAREDLRWYQRFELAPGVFTPGTSDVALLLELAGIPDRLDGATVLDLAARNGGAAFECERRGARRVVAVDAADENWFGFAALRDALGSRVEHVQASMYEVPELLGEQFDVVLFWGLLYQLRHPLLALDSVRRVSRGVVSIETAICDYELQDRRDLPLARFFRGDELAGDTSNWFAPNLAAVTDWCCSCGLEPTAVRSWPDGAPGRAMVLASAGEPEYPGMSLERPLRCTVLPPSGRVDG